MNAKGTSRRFTCSLKSFLLVTICIALFVGWFTRVAIEFASKNAAKNAAIDAIAEEDTNPDMFSAEGAYINDSSDGDPYTIAFYGLDSEAIAVNIQRVTDIESVIVLRLRGSMFQADSLESAGPNLRIRELSLDYSRGLTPETCNLLVRIFPRLHEISLKASDIEADGLEAFSKLDYLRTIDASELSVSAAEIARVCVLFPGLEHLVINHADLSGSLADFCKLPHLKKLDISLGSFSESDWASFLDCTACEEVTAIAVELDRQKMERHAKGIRPIVDLGLAPTQIGFQGKGAEVRSGNAVQ